MSKIQKILHLSYFILIALLCRPFSLKADAFPHSPQALGGLVLSLELIGSYEISIQENNGLLFWGGMATVFSPIGLDFYGGPEAAIEVRHYFTSKKGKLYSGSLYAGGAFNIYREPYSAFTPGIKLTRIKSIDNSFKLEPYLSLSYPYYIEEKNFPFLPLLTIGCRMVIAKKNN